MTLQARNLTVGYNGEPTLAGIDVGLEAGQVVCLLGPNGAGKSTLLRALVGIDAPIDGTVELRGEPLQERNRTWRAQRIGVVLTERFAAGYMRGEDLVAMGRHAHTGWHGRLRGQDRAAIDDAIDATGAVALRDRRVAEISDGERQRLLLAMALAVEPELLVLDEPTAFLDLPRRLELFALLRRLARGRGLGVLLTTHDLQLALHVADRLWLATDDRTVVAGSPEALVLDGTVEHLFAPRTDELLVDLHHEATVLRTSDVLAVAVDVEGRRRPVVERLLRRHDIMVAADGRAELTLRARGDGWELVGACGEQHFRDVDTLATAVAQLRRTAGDA